MLFSEARGRASGAPYVYSIDSIKEFQAAGLQLLRRVRSGRRRSGQRHHQDRHQRTSTATSSTTCAIPTLNALDPYNKFQALHNNGNPFLLTQPVHQQQQFGGSVGGPIIKDRLFFFFTYDGFRKVGRVLYTNTNIISLTSLGSHHQHDHGHHPTQCPTTITATQCTAGINFLLNVGNVAVGAAPPARFQKQNLFFPRLDWHINSRNDVFVDYNFADYDSHLRLQPGQHLLQQLALDQRPHQLPRALPGRRPHHPDRQGLRQPDPLPVRSRS